MLWYPTGYGEPALYNLTVKMYDNFHEVSVNILFGLRKFEIVREDMEYGKSFYFKINDIVVYAKGANLVPIDEFATTITEKRQD